jgi:putative ABC transport system ATP-binding protein
LNDQGKTIVFVTHDVDIARFATRDLIFKDGHIIREQQVTDRLNAKKLLEALPVEPDFD